MKNNRQTLNDEIIGSQQQTQTGKSHDQRCIKNVLCACDGFIVRSSHAQFLFMSLDVFFLGGSIIRLQRFFFVTFRSSIFHWRDSADCFLKNIFRFSVVRKGIEIFFLCASSSSFSSHFNCYYCHGGFKWHAKMQAKTKDKVSTSLPKMCYLYGIDMQ